jgi:general secretion pathway protein G
MKQPHPSLRRRAFTLVEMLLVLVILAVLAAIVIPKMAGRGQQAKETAAKSDIAGMETALNMYEVDTGGYPSNLDALVNQPSNATGWKGPYLKQIKPDPWGNDYAYTFPAKKNASGFDLMSAGPDGQAGNDDDITNWANTRR